MTLFMDPAMAKRWSWREKLLFALGILVLIIEIARLVVTLNKHKETTYLPAATSTDAATEDL
ncbi:hypothetical protein D6792_02060 [Candidatus Parcubacteria bacterium]|nr:MAG: hypothetical protein D6792_02060 [Candidatus Parcubacteria bacterium]